MNAEQLIWTARQFYLDDVEQPYQWTDQFLLRFLNEAEKEACRRQRLIEDEATAAVCEITMVSGTATYTVDNRVLLVDRIRLSDGSELTKKTTEELYEESSVWRSATGTPTLYVQNNQTILVNPTPDDDDDGDTLYLSVWRLPLVDMTIDLSPEINPEYHESLLEWVAFRAYQMRDEETYNPDRAGSHLSLFNERFGTPLPAGVREHQKRSPKRLRLRPRPYITNIAVDEDSDWG